MKRVFLGIMLLTSVGCLRPRPVITVGKCYLMSPVYAKGLLGIERHVGWTTTEFDCNDIYIKENK